jgi:hypothetical protein
MSYNKNVVEEALFQIKNLEETLQENAKGILQSTMSEEIKQLVKESLKEQDEPGVDDQGNPDDDAVADDDFADDDDVMDYFLGNKPNIKKLSGEVELEDIVRDIEELMVINDEAHHIHDESLAWYKSIQDIHKLPTTVS